MKQLDKSLKEIHDLGEKKRWFWPTLIGTIGVSFLFFVYLFSNLISPTHTGSLFIVENAVKTFCILGISFLVTRIYSFIISAFYQSKFNKPAPRLAISLFNWSIIFLAVILILAGIYNQPAWSLITAGGLMGAGLAYALQGLIVDIFSGVVLDIENNFKTGDWIEVEKGVTGKVIKNSWRSVVLITPEDKLLVIPNGKIMSGDLTNHSRPGDAYYEHIELSLNHSVPLERAERILHSALLTVPELGKEKPLEVFAAESHSGGITYHIRYPVFDYAGGRLIRHKVLKALIDHLHQADLKISETLGEYALSRAKDFRLDPEPTFLTLLKATFLADILNDQEKLFLSTKMQRKEFSKESLILKQGETGHTMFLIAEGSVEIFKEEKEREEGRGVSLAILGPHDFFGEQGLLMGRARSSSVYAKTDVVLFQLAKEDLSSLFKKRPALIESLSKVMADRLVQTEKIIKSQHENQKSKELTAKEIFSHIKSFFEKN